MANSPTSPCDHVRSPSPYPPTVVPTEGGVSETETVVPSQGPPTVLPTEGGFSEIETVVPSPGPPTVVASEGKVSETETVVDGVTSALTLLQGLAEEAAAKPAKMGVKKNEKKKKTQKTGHPKKTLSVETPAAEASFLFHSAVLGSKHRGTGRR